METEAAKAVDWALNWPKWLNERLCRHVAQYGANQLQQLATELHCHVRLLELQWHVLLVRAAPKLLGYGEVQERHDWENDEDDWELRVVRMIWDALKGSCYTVLSKATRYKIIATWLPGRTHFGVKQAYIKYIKPFENDNNKDSTVALQDGATHSVSNIMTGMMIQAVIGLLMEWPGVQERHQAYLDLPAQQVAEYLLQKHPELMSTLPGSNAPAGSKPVSLKRKRKRTADPVHPGVQQTEQATANLDVLPYQTQSTTYPSAGAAAAGDTTDSVWLPLGRYSPGLSSSSSMSSSSGILPLGTPAANTVCNLATLQQLLSQTPNAAFTVLTGRESYSSCSSPGADGQDSSRSTGTAVTTAGLSFNSLVEQFSASQHHQTVPQQQEGAPTRRKRSRLSQSTAVQQCTQQGSAAAASGANSETIPGHDFAAYNMLGHEAGPGLGTSNGGNSHVSTTAAAAAAAGEAAAGPRPLKPASWGSLDSTAAGQLTDDQLTAVCDWSNAWYGVEQQFQAAAAETSGPEPACYAATGNQAWVPGSTVSASGSQQPQLTIQPQQHDSMDSLVRGTAATASTSMAAASSDGAYAAAACETAAVQLPAHTSSGCFLQQQEDWQQAQPLASIGFEALAAAAQLLLPDCEQAAELTTFAALHFGEETADVVHAAYEAWVQQEQVGQMAGLIPSDQGSASAGTDVNFCLPELTELMVVDAVEYGRLDESAFEATDKKSISEMLSDFDYLSDFETELGLNDCLELDTDDSSCLQSAVVRVSWLHRQ